MISNNPAPGGTGHSPTGTPYLPPSWVRPLMAVYVALAGLAGYLALFSGNPMAEKVGAVLGGVLAVLGPLLGIASPGARKLGVLALALGMTLTSTSAMASSDTVLGQRQTLAGAPPLGLRGAGGRGARVDPGARGMWRGHPRRGGHHRGGVLGGWASAPLGDFRSPGPARDGRLLPAGGHARWVGGFW